MSTDVQWKSFEQMNRDVREIIRRKYGKYVPKERLQREIPAVYHESAQEWKDAKARYVEKKVEWYLDTYPPGSEAYERWANKVGVEVDKSAPKTVREAQRKRQRGAIRQYLREQSNLELDRRAVTLGGFYNRFEDRIEVRRADPKLLAHEHLHALTYGKTPYGLLCDFDYVVDHEITESVTELYALDVVDEYIRTKLWTTGNRREPAPSQTEFYSREPARELTERTSPGEVANAYFGGRTTRRLKQVGKELSAPFEKKKAKKPELLLKRTHFPETPPESLVERLRRSLKDRLGGGGGGGGGKPLDAEKRPQGIVLPEGLGTRITSKRSVGGRRVQQPGLSYQQYQAIGRKRWQPKGTGRQEATTGLEFYDRLTAQRSSREQLERLRKQLERQQSMARTANRRPLTFDAGKGTSTVAGRTGEPLWKRTRKLREQSVPRPQPHRPTGSGVGPHVNIRSRYRPGYQKRYRPDGIEPRSDALTESAKRLGRHRPTLSVRSKPPLSELTVKSGDTLWDISRRLTGSGHNYHQLYDLNRDRIDHPDWIYPGDKIRIPRDWTTPTTLGARRPNSLNRLWTSQHR